MSTNYYIVPLAVINNNIPLGWVQQVHIAQFAAGAFLLQAVRGESSFKGPASPHGKHTYWSPVHDFATIETWADWKAVLNDSDYVIIDEYGTVIEKSVFIDRVENGDTEKRFHDLTNWYAANPHLAFGPRTDYLDSDGFSFEVREFS